MAPKQSENISPEEMQAAILRSGYLLEQRIKPRFDRHGYFVEVNQPYPDPATGISREYDLSAIRGKDLYKGKPGFMLFCIICECENNALPVVFFESTPLNFLMYSDVKYSGMPTMIWKRDGWLPLSSALDFEKFHHYFRGKVATQYCSFSKKQNHPWIATHLDSQHQTIAKLIDAVEASIDDHYDECFLPPKGHQEPIYLHFYYPLLVVQGELCLAKETRRSVRIVSTQHVRFRQDVWSANRRSSYQIDVIQESFLEKYLKMLDQEMETISVRFEQQDPDIRASIDKLLMRARRSRKKKPPFRQIFESL